MHKAHVFLLRCFSTYALYQRARELQVVDKSIIMIDIMRFIRLILLLFFYTIEIRKHFLVPRA